MGRIGISNLSIDLAALQASADAAAVAAAKVLADLHTKQ